MKRLRRPRLCRRHRNLLRPLLRGRRQALRLQRSSHAADTSASNDSSHTAAGASSTTAMHVRTGLVSFTDVPSNASSLRVRVTTQAGCTWTSQSGVDWLSVPGDMKSGDGRVDVRVLANTGPARSAAVVVAGQKRDDRAARSADLQCEPDAGARQRVSVRRSGVRVAEFSGWMRMGSHGSTELGDCYAAERERRGETSRCRPPPIRALRERRC